jgi:hypothetical protein
MQQTSTFIGYYPQEKFIFKHIPNCERIIVDMLEEYWGKYVVLFSSGRSALKAYLFYKGYSLHRHSMSVPKYLSKCVLDAITDFAFPKWFPDQAHALLYYHQYGYIQNSDSLLELGQKFDIIIEDCAHAFFHRSNLHIPAIVSFSKFFNVGCGGALILDSQQEKEEILAWRDTHLPLSNELENFIQSVFFANLDPCNQDTDSKNLLTVAYALILYYVRPLNSTLSNLPISYDELLDIKQKRLDCYEILRNNISNKRAKLFLNDVETPPFILPCCFSDHDSMNNLVREMSELGVQAAVYQIDVNKNQFSPMYEPAVILPCHQNIPYDILKRMGEILKKY